MQEVGEKKKKKNLPKKKAIKQNRNFFKNQTSLIKILDAVELPPLFY